MGKLRFCLLLLVLTVAPCAYAQQAASDSIKTHALSEIWIRDPFILTDTLNQTYYLFGTTSSTQKPGSAGFDLYTSKDLVSWQGPYAIFRPYKGFWGSKNYWAPECHAYQGKYYLFATFFDTTANLRGTTILVADQPNGPFTEHAMGRITPQEWGALDGTLYIDRQGNPWMVFCHEWTQIGDGTVEALPLQKDLKAPVGKPVTLFNASSAPWVKPYAPQKFVTDGPYMFRNKRGELFMLWSSFGEEGYALGMARSRNGDIQGPWEHLSKPLFARNGGHGMLFRTLNGQLMLTLHQPNEWPDERAQLFLIEEDDQGIPFVTTRLTPADAIKGANDIE